MFRRFLLFLMVSAMLVGVYACGGQKKAETQQEPQQQTEVAQPDTSAAMDTAQVDSM